MARCYSAGMRKRQPDLPDIWLLSDARNDSALEAALRSFAGPIGFVFRHYHLAGPERRARFDQLRRVCLAQGHVVIVAGDARLAKRWRADGYYAAPGQLHRRRSELIALATVHDARELAVANRYGANAIMISPIYPTRSHPGAKVLGPVRFRHLARLATVPVIALGGMTQARAHALRWPRWAAIDGLS